MSTSNRPRKGITTDMESQKSPDLDGASPKKDHITGVSEPRQRTMEDTENGEALEKAALFAAKKHQRVQPSARSDQTWATSQQKTNTQGQDVDKMDIGSSNKERELDVNLIMEATKKLGIKPASEVKTDLEWAERVLQHPSPTFIH